MPNGEHSDVMRMSDHKEESSPSPPGTSLLSAQVESHKEPEVPKITSTFASDLELGGTYNLIHIMSFPLVHVFCLGSMLSTRVNT